MFTGPSFTGSSTSTGKIWLLISGMAAEIYADRTPENLARQENVEELLGSIQEFVEGRKEEGRQGEAGLADFLQEVSLQTTLDSEGNDEDSRVSLMTVHSAKGLEAPCLSSDWRRTSFQVCSQWAVAENLKKSADCSMWP